MAQLDGLRALAVGAVLAEHYVPWVSRNLHLGLAGVWLFFVLSGFLITGLLLQARERVGPLGRGRGGVLGAFYARRFLRIVPVYYVLLVVTAVAGLPQTRANFVWNATYLANVRTALRGDWLYQPIGHLWSLSVEEQFYLVWPALVLFAPLRLLPFVFAAVAVGAPLFRLAVLSAPASVVTATVLTPSCLDALGGGALLALLTQRRVGPRTRRAGRILLWACGLAGLGLYALVVWSPFGKPAAFRAVWAGAAYSLFFVWLVARSARGLSGWAGWVLGCKPLVYLGTISYGIYLFHYFVPLAVRALEKRFDPLWLNMPEDPGPELFGYVALVSVAAAAVSWHLFEKPINGLKRYFPYERPRREYPEP